MNDRRRSQAGYVSASGRTLERGTAASFPQDEVGAPRGNRSATRRREERTRLILEVALQVLAEHGHGELTLREVARGAGMRLSNLQYYYPSRDHLLNDLLRFIFENYTRKLEEIASDASLSPRQRLSATVDYLVEDNKTSRTNLIFFEIWSLAQRNPYAAELLDRRYTEYCRHLEGMIAAISPDMPAEKRVQRAALIAFQIEGLMVLLGAAMPRHAALVGIEEECAAQAQRLASWP
jgi:AcrR family transcriptional regulator